MGKASLEAGLYSVTSEHPGKLLKSSQDGRYCGGNCCFCRARRAVIVCSGLEATTGLGTSTAAGAFDAVTGVSSFASSTETRVLSITFAESNGFSLLDFNS